VTAAVLSLKAPPLPRGLSNSHSEADTSTACAVCCAVSCCAALLPPGGWQAFVAGGVPQQHCPRVSTWGGGTRLCYTQRSSTGQQVGGGVVGVGWGGVGDQQSISRVVEIGLAVGWGGGRCYHPLAPPPS